MIVRQTQSAYRQVQTCRMINRQLTSSSGRKIAAAHSAPPLVKLDKAIFRSKVTDNEQHTFAPLSLTISDSASELWAVIAPGSTSSGPGVQMLSSLTSTLAGRTRPQQQIEKDLDASFAQNKIHPFVHPFASLDPSRIALASFSKQQDVRGGNSTIGEFQDFSTRYGAYREEDFVTLYEQIMYDQGFEVGRVAQLRIVSDKLNDVDSSSVEEDVRMHARMTHDLIQKFAPLLGLDKPVPGTGANGPPLLHQPIISLSNGQTRRASICGALVGLARSSDKGNASTTSSLLVLVQPFSGLDEPSRDELSTVLNSLHDKATPRVIMVLRRQDELPSGVTHIIDIDENGRIWTGPRAQWQGSRIERPKGVDGIRKNNANGIGVGSQGKEVASLHNVSVRYGATTVLDNVRLTLCQGSRLVIKGANGSGKTTLLALLNGTHPQSYSFEDGAFRLFGLPRSAPANATRLLNTKIGYFGPDLFNAFPRKSVESGGLTVGQAIASGFAGVYSRVTLNEVQRKRVRSLLSEFIDCIALRDDGKQGKGAFDATHEQQTGDEFLSHPFAALNTGSQAMVLFLRAIVHRPELLILDEPFQGMDAVQISRIREFIDGSSMALSSAASVEDESNVQPHRHAEVDAEQWKETMAVVLVSHYVNEWPNTMGEFMLLDAGKIVERV